MKKRTNVVKALSVFLSFLMVLSVIAFPTLKAKAEEPKGTVDDFVERCYTVTLERPSDIDGFNYWKGKLLNGEAVGIEVAYGFLFSPEYTKKNKSNSAYVRDLYALFMGRDPDDSGYNDWMNRLDEGQSRLDVFAGFANSVEFYNLCCDYEITAGRYVTGYDRETINNVNLFVERLYKICLGRIGDRDGQKNWVEKLLRKEISGTECARSFIQSQEYVNKGLWDSSYVENLYLAMMGRPYDEEGFNNWINALSEGKTRDEVFAGFANSAEFAQICAKYHIDKGSYTAKDTDNTDYNETPVFKMYRSTRVDYSNGDYVIVKFQGYNDEISRIRYDKNGNYLGYDYRNETMSNGDYYNGYKTYYDDGTTSSYYLKITYSSDRSVRTEYTYSDEWKTLDYYDVYNDVTYTYTSPTDNYTSTHPVSGTFYDDDGTKIGSIVYTYYSDNRPKSTKQYDASGKISWEQEYEFYDKKGYEYQYVKKYTSTQYSSDGKILQKDIDEYDENENLIKQTTYIDGALNMYVIYEYDAKGQKTKTTFYTADNKVSGYFVYKYDYYGNLVRETNYSWGVYTGYTEHTYDANKNLVKSVYYDQDNMVYAYSGYDRNANGQLLRYYSYSGTDLREDLYEYNADNYITKYSKSLNGSVYYWEKITYEEYTE